MTQVRGAGRELIGVIASAEWRWVALVSAAVMAFTCLPYLFGWYITPPGYDYSGLLANPDEHNVYLGWMRQAQRGRLLFFDPFTTEPQQAGFFHGFFLALGLAARFTRLPLIWVYHIARVVSGLLLLGAVYALAAQVFERRFTRRLAWAFVALSSGFGWLYHLARPETPVHPIDFGPGLVMPEAITFLSLLLNPLFCFSVFLMVALLALYLSALRRSSWKLAALAGAAALALGNVHTYDVITVWCTLAAHVGAAGISARRWPQREARFAALISAMAAPFVIYQYWLFRANAVFREKALTPTLTPPVPFVMGYGVVLLLAAGGAVEAVRRRGGATLFAVWAAGTLLLALVAPVSFQRKLAEGLHVPLCLLAALLVGERLVAKLPQRTAVALAVALVAATVPSNLFFIARGVRDLVTNNQAYLHVLMPPLYLRSDVVGAATWLRSNARMDEAVLCTPLAGSYLPGIAGNKVFIGHWAETLHYPEKLAALRWFFSDGALPPARRQFMRENGIHYLLYTPDEQALGSFDPAESADFERVVKRPGAILFRLASGGR